MNILRRMMAVFGMLCLSCLTAFVVQAAEPDASLQGDKVCTRCHDETESRPVLAIYKTAHGVKADSRTPGCQSCHGPSEAHVTNPKGSSTRPQVDIDFNPRSGSTPQILAQTCLTCHQNGQRTHWDGSEHEHNGLVCTSCHEIHTHGDRVLNKVSQPEVCFTCHTAQHAQFHRVSTHPVVAGEMGCSDCHNPHGSVGPHLMRQAGRLRSASRSCTMRTSCGFDRGIAIGCDRQKRRPGRNSR